MNYTQNHHLPQWEKDDRIMMEDFNQMCADMEAGLNAGTAGTERARAAAAAAQSTADQAVSAAARAQAKADAAYAPGQLPYAIGQYKGNGESLAVNLGFRPSFLLIGGGYGGANFGALADGNAGTEQLTITDAGFRVKRVMSSGEPIQEIAPYLCQERETYTYIAFR